jgi:WD40 repeat protein
MNIKLLALVSTVLLASACASQQPYERADIVITDAHGGGQVVSFNSSGTLLASGGWEGDLKLWNPQDGKQLHAWRAHADSLTAITFIDNDHKLLTAGYDSTVALWNTQGKLLQRFAMPTTVTELLVDTPRKQVITSHKDGHVRRWQLPTFKAISAEKIHRGLILSLALHLPTGTLASSGADGRVFIRKQTGKWQTLPAPPTDAHSLSFSPRGDVLVGAGWFRLFRWQLAGKQLQVLDTDHYGLISSVQYSHDGDYIASISRQTDSAVLFLDPASGSVKQRFQPHELCGSDIVLSPGQRFLATTSDDASIMIWKLRKQ